MGRMERTKDGDYDQAYQTKDTHDVCCCYLALEAEISGFLSRK